MNTPNSRVDKKKITAATSAAVLPFSRWPTALVILILISHMSSRGNSSSNRFASIQRNGAGSLEHGCPASKILLNLRGGNKGWPWPATNPWPKMNWSLTNAIMEPDVYQTWRATPMVKFVIPTPLTRYEDSTWSGQSAREWVHSWGGNSSTEEHQHRRRQLLYNTTAYNLNNTTSAKATTNAAPADGSSSLQPSLLGIPPRPSPPAPAPKLVARIEDFPSHLPRGQTTAAATADITGNYTMVKLPSTSADLTRLPAASFERVEAIWAIVTGWTYLDEVEGRICELIHQMFVPWVPIDFTKNLRFYIRHIPKLLQVVILWTIGAYLLPIKFTVYVGINFPRLASKELKNMIFAWSKGQAIQYAVSKMLSSPTSFLVCASVIYRLLRRFFPWH